MRPNPPHPAFEPVRLQTVADVLDVAARTALHSWDIERCDFYHCLSRAWRATGMSVPYGSLTAAVRRYAAATHPDRSLLEINDDAGMTRQHAAEFFTAARQALTARASCCTVSRIDHARSAADPRLANTQHPLAATAS